MALVYDDPLKEFVARFDTRRWVDIFEQSWNPSEHASMRTEMRAATGVFAASLGHEKREETRVRFDAVIDLGKDDYRDATSDITRQDRMLPAARRDT